MKPKRHISIIVLLLAVVLVILIALGILWLLGDNGFEKAGHRNPFYADMAPKLVQGTDF